MRRTLGAFATVVGAAVLVIQATSAPVGAGVSNPGATTILLDTLSISIGTQTASYNAAAAPGCSDGVDDANDTDTAVDYPADPQCTSPSDDSETKTGSQPHVTPKLVGTVNEAGTISVTTSGVTLPVFYLENSSAGGDGVVTVTPRAAQPVTGTINPDSGVLSLRLRLLVDLDAANLPGSCAIGSSTSPIDMASLSTGSSGGVAYSSTTGAARLTDHTYTIPATSGCGLFGPAIDDALGVPSASGNNHAVFDARVSPAITPGVATTSSTQASTTSTTSATTTTVRTTSTTNATSTTSTTRPIFTWPRRTTTTTTVAPTTTTTVRPTTSTTGRPPVTTTTTRPWWCTWCA